MGTFAGHALPGSFFIIFALWAAYHMIKVFYRRKAYDLKRTLDRVPKYTNRVSFPISLNGCGCCRPKAIPIDSYLKTLACIIGITGEVYTGFSNEWKFVHIGNAQHSTMFAMFGLSGIVEVLMFYEWLKLPMQVEYLFNMLALLSEFFLFVFHLHARTTTDVYIHLLLAGMIPLGIVFGVCELVSPHNIIFGLMRNWTFLMQGTWFWQVGSILYPPVSWMPKWDELAIESIPRAANLFCYHFLVNFLAIVFLCFVFSIRMQCKHSRANLESGNSSWRRGVNQMETADDGVELTDETELWSRPTNHNEQNGDVPLVAPS